MMKELFLYIMVFSQKISMINIIKICYMEDLTNLIYTINRSFLHRMKTK